MTPHKEPRIGAALTERIWQRGLARLLSVGRSLHINKIPGGNYAAGNPKINGKDRTRTRTTLPRRDRFQGGCDTIPLTFPRLFVLYPGEKAAAMLRSLRENTSAFPGGMVKKKPGQNVPAKKRSFEYGNE